MTSKIIQNTGVKRTLEFTVPAQKVDECFLKNYQKLQSKVKWDGFRQGKVPLNQVKSRYKDQAFKEVMEDLFGVFYPLALKENKIKPAGQPTLLNLTLEEGKDSYFVVELEVHPEVKVENYLNLELKKKEIVVSEKDVDQALQRLRESCPIYEESLLIDQVAQKGSYLKLDFRVFNFENKLLFSKADILLPVGEDQLAKGFDQQILGLTRDQEKEFDFTFPKEYFNTQLAGKTLKVKVKVKSFQNKKIPELNEDFAKRFKAENMTELKEKIKSDLQKNQEQRQKESLENAMIEQLIQKNPVDIPQSVIANQKETLIKNIKKRLQEYNMPPDQQELYLKKHESTIEKEAKSSVHSSYLLEQLVKDLKIELSPEDIQNSLKESFPNKNAKDMEQELKKAHYWDAFLFNLTRQKAISYLMEKASLVKD